MLDGAGPHSDGREARQSEVEQASYGHWLSAIFHAGMVERKNKKNLDEKSTFKGKDHRNFECVALVRLVVRLVVSQTVSCKLLILLAKASFLISLLTTYKKKELSRPAGK